MTRGHVKQGKESKGKKTCAVKGLRIGPSVPHQDLRTRYVVVSCQPRQIQAIVSCLSGSEGVSPLRGTTMSLDVMIVCVEYEFINGSYISETECMFYCYPPRTLPVRGGRSPVKSGGRSNGHSA